MSQVILRMKNMFPKITEKLVNILLWLFVHMKAEYMPMYCTYESSHFYIWTYIRMCVKFLVTKFRHGFEMFIDFFHTKHMFMKQKALLI